jgi:diaminohydroxyphosphoribosylaminopyrimidine deaminase/5-amino-6-(5-phosphoribosylamino)uracil reductase
MVALKLATSLDGRIALANGKSQWITGPEARQRAHLLRATHDAILVGTGTVAADDPQLTCRIAGLENRSPVRIVLDQSLRLPPAARVFDGAAPTWLIHGPGVDAAHAEVLRRKGVELLEIAAGTDGKLDLAGLFARLGERGLTRVLVESGGKFAAALIRAGLVDRLYWFRAGAIIGGDGRAAIADLGLQDLDRMSRFRLLGRHACGQDAMEIWSPAA